MGVRISLSVSLFVGVFSGVVISSAFGMSWSSCYLLLTAVAEESMSSCCCVLGGVCDSGVVVVPGDDMVAGDIILVSGSVGLVAVGSGSGFCVSFIDGLKGLLFICISSSICVSGIILGSSIGVFLVGFCFFTLVCFCSVVGFDIGG